MKDRDLENERALAVDETVGRIRDIENRLGVTREALAEMMDELYGLASRVEMFPRSRFPPPDALGESVLYRLSEDDDRRFALYLNSISPGKTTKPHNHTTWAIVVAIEGAESNTLYARTDDGAVPGKATVIVDRELTVEPGSGIALMPDDIHSIAVEGDQSTLHLHMYGRALETLTERIGFDLENGTYQFLKVPGHIQG